MDLVCEEAREFLSALFDSAGFQLSISVRQEQDDCHIAFTGDDAVLLLTSAGELLDAVEYIANKAYLRHLAPGRRIICDANDYRAIREVELRTMAQHAAEHVRQTGQPFVFAPMSANERRVIHKALEEDISVTTVSFNDGNTRRLQVTRAL
jgi:spoIIIJ-associated protein